MVSSLWLVIETNINSFSRYALMVLARQGARASKGMASVACNLCFLVLRLFRDAKEHRSFR
jgi:hypothetical protein